ncbi:MAG: hypothetical protein IT160_07060 [Bryobacterales bacterium]|nr:hypothetical protein [Bryobacterales bacterium]
MTASTLQGTGAQVAATGVQTGGAALTSLAAGASWVPVVGPIVAGATLAIGLIANRKGPRQKVAATQIVDELEPELKRNRDGYFAGPRTMSSQAQALANFDQAWAILTSPQYLGNPELGEPGRRGIKDRDRGGKWDWFSYYRDPIEFDPDVRPDPTAAEQLTQFAQQVSTSSQWPLYAGAGLILLALVI